MVSDSNVASFDCGSLSQYLCFKVGHWTFLYLGILCLFSDVQNKDMSVGACVCVCCCYIILICWLIILYNVIKWFLSESVKYCFLSSSINNYIVNEIVFEFSGSSIRFFYPLESIFKIEIKNRGSVCWFNLCKNLILY